MSFFLFCFSFHSQNVNFQCFQSFGKTLTNKPEEEEICWICMDTPIDPKRLHECGHIFCKDHIDEYFSYKPACPNCGQIYGKMTGDQPPGTLSIKKYHQSLSGFYDSKDCIVLTYTFQHGRQGVSSVLILLCNSIYPV